MIFIPSCIYFPRRDGRDYFDYLKLLNLFGQIHFNYCEFYLSSLDLKDVECFFQDCKFYTDWTLYNYNLLANQDNVIYQTCEFYKSVSNYTPENQKKLTVYEYSQFDYSCIFKEYLNFDRVVFKNRLFNTEQFNYSDNKHIKILKFNKCTFEKEFIFNDYNINEFILNDSTFKDKLEFVNNSIDNINIENTKFEQISIFTKNKFINFHIRNSIFNNNVDFSNSIFGKKDAMKSEATKFQSVTIEKNINFRKTKFYYGLDIPNTTISDLSNFLEADLAIKNTPRDTFRRLKYEFDSIGNKIEANKYFIQEMKKYKEDLKKKPLIGNIQEKIIFNLNDIFSSFGQSYFKPILWLIGFVLIYNFILYGYEQNCLYKIYPSANLYIQSFTNFFNNIAKNILPFAKFLKKDLEFLSLLFYIIFSILIWQIIVSIKRYTKR